MGKWLLQIKPSINISEDNDYTFCRACANGKLEIAVWLQTLKPYLYKINYDINGKYVSHYVRTKAEAKEARWQEIKYLVWFGKKNSNKKCMLNKLPSDIVRYIIQSFIQ